MRVVDSSVAIAAFASWHESHRSARAEVIDGPRIAGHALLETFSVLTRLPAPHRARPGLVVDFLDAAFPADPLAMSGSDYREFVVEALPRHGIIGGPAYDALIAETTRRAGGVLVTLDQRALTTYQRVGCPAELLE